MKIALVYFDKGDETQRKVAEFWVKSAKNAIPRDSLMIVTDKKSKTPWDLETFRIDPFRIRGDKTTELIRKNPKGQSNDYKECLCLGAALNLDHDLLLMDADAIVEKDPRDFIKSLDTGESIILLAEDARSSELKVYQTNTPIKNSGVMYWPQGEFQNREKVYLEYQKAYHRLMREAKYEEWWRREFIAQDAYSLAADKFGKTSLPISLNNYMEGNKDRFIMHYYKDKNRLYELIRS